MAAELDDDLLDNWEEIEENPVGEGGQEGVRGKIGGKGK